MSFTGPSEIVKGDNPERWLPWFRAAARFRIDFGPGPQPTTAGRFRELVERLGTAAVVEYLPRTRTILADLYAEPEPL